MRTLTILLFAALLISACNKADKDLVENSCSPIILSSDDFNDITNEVQVTDLSILDNCLTVTMAFSGCDEDHNIDIVSDRSIAESLPPQITFKTRDNTPELCQAFFSEVTREYDLSTIRTQLGVEEDIVINFFGTGDGSNSILYEY